MTANAAIDERSSTKAGDARRQGAWALVRQYAELVRFSHTLFALPFALTAATMAWTRTAASLDHGGRTRPAFWHAWRWQEVIGIVLCMVTARTAAMAFNRLADRRIDAANPRTRSRHLPAGLLGTAAVGGLAIGSGLAFVATTLLFWPNWLPLALALPVLAFLLGYSLAKRFTAASHLWLGCALAVSPIAAWIALRGSEVLAAPADVLPAVVLAGAVALWVAGFDMIYACQDVDFDRAAGLASVPARLGVAGALRLAAVCHAGMVLLLVALPWAFPALGRVYWCAVAAVTLLLVYEHRLVRPDDLARVNQAFFHVNAVLSLGLWIATTIDLSL